jgi:hypothetical protein|tara:strand:- start:507 stop:632 length:126 start_codon:yes stop_codon:yes gene_type:complete
MKKLKELFNKLVDKVFGKRCECTNKQKIQVKECLDCGQLIK